jgi:hypothetical protein
MAHKYCILTRTKEEDYVLPTSGVVVELKFVIVTKKILTSALQKLRKR